MPPVTGSGRKLQLALALQCILYRFEAPAMDRAGSKLNQGALMHWCGVAFVLGEGVAGILKAKRIHHPIALNLGDDRCRRHSRSDWQGAALTIGRAEYA